MSNSPSKIPSYLSLDAKSPWHIGALQSIAVDTMTLPSRLRSPNGLHSTLQALEETINNTGKRRIAKLALSVADPDILSDKAASQEEKSSTSNFRLTSNTNGDNEEEKMTNFDIDVFTKDYRVPGPKPRGRKEHVFGRAEASRGEWNLSANSRDPHDRFGDGPTVQKLVLMLTTQMNKMAYSS
jgi:hypothetical protein